MVMKKAFLVLAILVGSAALTFAQPKSIGGRLGNYGIDVSIDVSYENYVFGGADFLEFGLGLDNGFSTSSFHVDGIYNFMILEPDWTPVGHWGFYAGPGASVAVWKNSDDENTVYAGFLGNVGLEYTFNFPLQLSIDFRPRLMFGDGGLRSDGPFTLGIGVRYAF